MILNIILTNADNEQREALIKLAQPLPVHISTPVNIPYFTSVLQNHPQPELVQYLVHGLTFGFDIGTRVIPTLSRPRNHKSACVNAEGVTKAIAKELVMWLVHFLHHLGLISTALP